MNSMGFEASKPDRVSTKEKNGWWLNQYIPKTDLESIEFVVTMGGAAYYFNKDGKFVGLMTGDEQPSYDARSN